MASRFTEMYYAWRNTVLLKSSNKCNRCGSQKRLHAHHIQSWKENPELRFDIENGECVCYQCHLKIHPFMIKYEKIKRKRKQLQAKRLKIRQKLNKKKRRKFKGRNSNGKAKKKKKQWNTDHAVKRERKFSCVKRYAKRW